MTYSADRVVTGSLHCVTRRLCWSSAKRYFPAALGDRMYTKRTVYRVLGASGVGSRAPPARRADGTAVTIMTNEGTRVSAGTP